MSKILSTVYPTVSTLIYRVKIIANRMGMYMPSQNMTDMCLHKLSQTSEKDTHHVMQCYLHQMQTECTHEWFATIFSTRNGWIPMRT